MKISGLASMTGYSSSLIRLKQTEMSLAIRSVNGRFLEIRFHLPKELLGLEKDFKDLIGRFFQRGSVDVYLTMRARTSETQSIHFNESLALAYVEHIRAFSKKIKVPLAIHAESILRLPDVLTLNPDLMLGKSDLTKLKDGFLETVKACLAERLREGESLKKDLLNSLKHLEGVHTALQAREDDFRHDLKLKIEARLKSRMQNLEIDPSRLSQEIVYVLDKSDIHEELTRLQEHIQHFGKLLTGAKGPLGKKLDFYVQEFLRETNTIGSKSQNAELTALVVDAKSTIERMREQVQNLE